MHVAAEGLAGSVLHLPVQPSLVAISAQAKIGKHMNKCINETLINQLIYLKLNWTTSSLPVSPT